MEACHDEDISLGPYGEKLEQGPGATTPGARPSALLSTTQVVSACGMSQGYSTWAMLTTMHVWQCLETA